MAVEIMPHDQVRKSIIQGLREVLAGNIAVRPWYAVAAVMIATLMTSYHTRILALMLAELRGVWGLTYDEGAELNTVATALQLLIAPAIPLTAAIVGPRRVLLYCALGFAFLTFITPFMVGIKALLVVHGLTAILLGCFIPATLTVVFRNLPPRFWLLALSFYTLRLTVATYSGVSMAGIYIDELGWHFFYWQQTFFAMVVAGLTVYSLPIEKNINKALWKKTDKGSVAIFCISLTMIFAGLDEGNRLDWFESGKICALLTGGIVLFMFFIFWQFVSDAPFAHPRVLRRNVILPMTVGGFFGFLSMAGALAIPNFLGTVGGLKAEQSGKILWLVLLLQIFLVPLSIRLLRILDARLVTAMGVVAMMAGCWFGTFITHDWRAVNFVPALIAFAVGNAFVFLGVMTLAVANSRPADVIPVLAYAQIPRVLGPTLAASILTSLITQLEKIHSALLMPYTDMARSVVREAYNNGSTLSSMSNLIRQEAYVLAYRDLYQTIFVLGIFALLALMMMKPAPSNAMTPNGYTEH